MNTIFSICKPWSEMILSGVKEYEFRGVRAKNISSGDKIYIYESKTNHGIGMVVGEVVVDEIVELTKNRIGPDKYFLRKFAKETKNTEALNALDKIGDFQLSNYRNGTIYSFMFCDKLIDNIIKNDKYPEETIDPFYLGSNPEIISQLNKAKLFLNACDSWLFSLGFYNYDMKSYYNTSYKLVNPIRYDNPIPITNFIKQDGKSFTRSPQSWAYTQN